MKKILLFFLFAVFFSSCPLMEDTSECAGFTRTFEIWTENNLSFDANCSMTTYFNIINVADSCHRNDLASIFKEERERIIYFDLGYLDSFKNNDTLNLSKVFNEFLYDKHFVVTSLSGDTLANWRDGSAVFDPKYWFLEPQENGDVHCTLQLTDEVLQLK